MPKAETVSKLLLKAAPLFSKAGLDTPELDAKLLLQAASGYTNVELISKSKEALQSEICETFYGFVERRLNHEPVHRILGYREFYGRQFILSDETLIPRPDTEILVECGLKAKPTSVLEIGTGSGAIAVSLASELPDVKITATDISKDAVKTAQKNAVKHNVDKKIKFVETDLFKGLKGKFDLVISNPPYIRKSDISDLQKEVQFHDPMHALDGGKDGLDFYRLIFKQVAGFLNPNGSVLVEIGIGQENDVIAIAKAEGFSKLEVIKDLNQVNRVVGASLND